MPIPGRRICSDETAVQVPPGTVARETARMRPERATLGKSVKTAVAVSPTESEIAAVAYQLWLDNGCPIGSDREDWFRAEAMLKDALAAKCEVLSRRPTIPRGETRTESQMLVAFRWGAHGHWEVWESEWGGSRWIWDEATPGVELSKRAAV